MLAVLAEAVDKLEVPSDGDTICDVLALMDRLEAKKLAKLSGADFDREFAQHEVKDHEKDIKKFEKETAKLKDADLKAWAEKQLPVLREHLAMAQKLSAAGEKSASNAPAAPNTRAAGNKGSKY